MTSFRLKPVHRLRQLAEREAKLELAGLLAEEVALEAQAEQVALELADLAGEFREAGSIFWYEQILRSFTQKSFDQSLVRKRLLEQREAVDHGRAALAEAVRGRRLLDTLEEKARKRQSQEELRVEQAQLDELTVIGGRR